MAETVAVAAPRPPLWRNLRFRRVVGQVVFALAVVVVGRELFLNLEFNSAARRQDLGFGFVDSQAGFEIADSPIDYRSTNPVSRAFQVGIVNTLRVSILGIVLTSILGLVIGVARLSPNWMVRKLAQVYVEVIRNTPVPLQVVFWWAAVFLAIPSIQNRLSLFDVVFLSNRGLDVLGLRLESGASAWGLSLLLGAVAGVVVWRWRTRLNERTGRPHHRVLWLLGVFLAVGVVGYLATGTPTRSSVPEIAESGFSLEGGIHFSTEFAALLIALVVYTAAFIAEIIRGSIQAVPKGQREAAESLGLSRFQQLRFVILPQALRVAIPAINSQYLNLLKNSSLGILIGFYELLRVSRSIISGRGHETQVLLVAMASFLVMCLAISFVMNLINRAVTIRGTR
ncbi:MAG: amino acid ABC transporter permease [Actinomycetota bacterium]